MITKADKIFAVIALVIILMLIAVYNMPADPLEELKYIRTSYTLEEKYLPLLVEFSQSHGVSLPVLCNWITAESSGSQTAYNSRSKDYGLCQLHDVGYLKSKYWNMAEAFNVWNGQHNLKVALSYLSDLISEFGVEYGFMAYNIGPGRVRRGNILECGKRYVKKIIPEVIEPEVICYIQGRNDIQLSFTDQILFYDRRLYVL